MFKTAGDFIIYDRQGPLGSIIKHALKKTDINVYRHKKISGIENDIKKQSEITFIFILFVFNEEYELIDCIRLVKLGIPIVFAPINKNCYKILYKLKGVRVMDVSASKDEYVSQIINILES